MAFTTEVTEDTENSKDLDTTTKAKERGRQSQRRCRSAAGFQAVPLLTLSASSLLESVDVVAVCQSWPFSVLSVPSVVNASLPCYAIG